MRECELCGREYDEVLRFQRPWKIKIRLAGLCQECSDHLGGGKYSARVVIEEHKKMEKRKR